LRFAQGENISDTISSSIGATDLTIPVNSISKWNSNGGNIIIDRNTAAQEIIVVTGVSGSSLVVASGGRGFDGTTGVGHNSGATVESVPFAKDWNDLVTTLLNLVVLAGTVDSTKIPVVSGGYATTLTTTAATGVTLPTTGTLSTLAGTETLTNKRVTPRVVTATSYTTDTGTSLSSDTTDIFIVTAQAGALKFNNPSGTPTDGQKLWLAVTGTAARALTYDTAYESSAGATLPTTTVTTARIDIGLVYRTDTSKWHCVAVS